MSARLRNTRFQPPPNRLGASQAVLWQIDSCRRLCQWLLATSNPTGAEKNPLSGGSLSLLRCPRSKPCCQSCTGKRGACVDAGLAKHHGAVGAMSHTERNRCCPLAHLHVRLPCAERVGGHDASPHWAHCHMPGPSATSTTDPHRWHGLVAVVLAGRSTASRTQSLSLRPCACDWRTHRALVPGGALMTMVSVTLRSGGLVPL